MAKSPQTPGRDVLAVDSAWDSATKSASSYRSNHVYPYLSKRRISISRLEGPMAQREFFKREARKKEVLMITGIGHGSDSVFTGEMGEPLLETGEYAPREVRDKIIHLLSCKTARVLGPDLIENGARAFFGYSRNFTFDWKFADEFFACDSEIDRAFADGLTAAEVHGRVAALFDEQIDLLADKDGAAAALLTADLRYLCSPAVSEKFGQLDAKLRFA